MEKNYNFNYENRNSVKGSETSGISLGTVQQASCKSSELKKQPVCNGRLWHTTDTNKFYFDWNGKRQELNVSGDNASLEAEINKLKAKVNALDVTTVQNKINQLETKVNNAASQAQTAKNAAQTARQQAQEAAQQAQEAADSVASKASTEYVDNAVADKVSSSELNQYAKKTDIPSVEGFATEQWVEGKGYLTQHQDISGKADKSDLFSGDYNDLSNKPTIPTVPENVSAFTNDAGYLTQHQDISGKADKSELFSGDYNDLSNKPSIPTVPENVSAFTNDAGYLTQHQDISGKADKSDLPEKVSDLTNDAGYLTYADLPDFVTGSELPDVTEGVFPSGADVEDTSATSDGFATVQDVMDYVNALIEKKKDELGPVDPGTPYAYITGYPIGETATDITVFNAFELNEDSDTEIEFMTSDELSVWDPATYVDLPAVKLIVDIPNGYTLSEEYIWNPITNQYDDLTVDNRIFATNPRYSSRRINGVTYNSYARGPVDDVTARAAAQYKIKITKQ